MPASTPSVSATGRWRMRWSVINHISCSIVSLCPVVDLAVMRSATLRSSAAADRAPRPRTTSRSERMPSIVRPSEDDRSADPSFVEQGNRAAHGGVGGDGRHLRPLRGQDALDVHRNLPEVPTPRRLVSPTRQVVAGRTPHVSTGWDEGSARRVDVVDEERRGIAPGWRRTSSGGS